MTYCESCGSTQFKFRKYVWGLKMVCGICEETIAECLPRSYKSESIVMYEVQIKPIPPKKELTRDEAKELTPAKPCAKCGGYYPGDCTCENKYPSDCNCSGCRTLRLSQEARIYAGYETKRGRIY